jgi:hypothetical protein
VTPDTLTLRPDLSLAPPLSRVPRSSSPIGLGLSPGSPSFLRPRPPSSTSFYWALYAPLPPRQKSGYTPTGSPYCSAAPLLPGAYSRTPERSPESSPRSTTLTHGSSTCRPSPPRRTTRALPWSMLHYTCCPRSCCKTGFSTVDLRWWKQRKPCASPLWETRLQTSSDTFGHKPYSSGTRQSRRPEFKPARASTTLWQVWVVAWISLPPDTDVSAPHTRHWRVPVHGK